MDVQYDGKYSLLIGDFNSDGEFDESLFIDTWEDWHLIPSSKTVIAPPSIQDNTVDIPGINGTIDMSSTLLGYPLYKNRTGSLDFYLDHNSWDFDTAYDTLMNEIHGFTKKIFVKGDKIIQETEVKRVPEPTPGDIAAITAEVTAEANDPELHPEFVDNPNAKEAFIESQTQVRLNERFPWTTVVVSEHNAGLSYYFEGRLWVNSFASDKLASKIVLNYDLAPFKRMIFDTTGDWLWNPFDFVNGVIPDENWFQGTIPSGTETNWIVLTPGIAGTMPQVPVVIQGGSTPLGSNISKTNSLAAGQTGFKMEYVDADGYDVSEFYSVWDYGAEEGSSMTQAMITSPKIIVGDPRQSQFRYKFINNLRDENDNGVTGIYSFNFRPGRL